MTEMNNANQVASGQPSGAPAPVPPAPPAPSSGAPAPVPPVPPSVQETQAQNHVPPAGQQPAPGYVPPAQQQMPPQQPFVQPAPAPAPIPQNIPGMPLLNLTSGMKFGWAVCGFVMGPIAILLAWLTNAHNFPEAKSAAVKFSLIGFLAQFAVAFLLMMLFGMATCAAISSAASYYYY